MPQSRPRNKFELESQYNFRLDISQLIPESGLAIERLLGALYNEKPKRELPSKCQKNSVSPVTPGSAAGIEVSCP